MVYIYNIFVVIKIKFRELYLYMFFNKKRISLLVLLLLNIWVSLSSQITTDTIKQLDEVTVINDSRKKEIRSIIPLQTLNNKELSKINALQISDAIKFFSGVTIKDYGGVGGLKTLSVRSLGANHTVVSYDGIAISDIETGQIDLGKFSTNNIGLVSLSNGQYDNLLQSARLFASGTVLNIQTSRPFFLRKERIKGFGALKIGSWKLINPIISLQSKITNKLSLSMVGEYLTTDGEYPYILNYGFEGKDSTSNEVRKNSDVEKIRLETTLFAYLSSREDLRIKLYYYNSQRGLPGATIFYNTQNFSSQRIKENTFFTQGSYRKDFSERWSALLNMKYHRGYLKYVDSDFLNAKGKIENKYIQQEYYFSGATRCFMSDNLSFSFSNDISWSKLDANLPQFVYPTRFTNLSVLATKFRTKQVRATANLLSTIVQESVKKGKSGKNYQKLSPYVSFSVLPFSDIDLRIRAFYKNSFRMPTFNDLYYSRIGNRNLVPEKINQFNVGVTFQTSINKTISHVSLTSDIYHNDIKDKIVAYPTKNIFIWTMLNYGRVSIDGLDLTFKGIIEPFPKYIVTLNSSYTYQRALNVTDKSSREYRHQIPYTPRVSGANRVSIETPYLNLSYSMLWSGKRYALQQNYRENRLAGYSEHIFMIFKNYKIGRNMIKINLQLLNAFNQNYSVVRYFPMSGRSWRATISYQF